MVYPVYMMKLARQAGSCSSSTRQAMNVCNNTPFEQKESHLIKPARQVLDELAWSDGWSSTQMHQALVEPVQWMLALSSTQTCLTRAWCMVQKHLTSAWQALEPALSQKRSITPCSYLTRQPSVWKQFNVKQIAIVKRRTKI